MQPPMLLARVLLRYKPENLVPHTMRKLVLDVTRYSLLLSRLHEMAGLVMVSVGVGRAPVVVELVGEATKIAFPHEICHYLGLDHVGDPTNLMYETTSNGGHLTFGQGVEMAAHCFVRFP